MPKGENVRSMALEFMSTMGESKALEVGIIVNGILELQY